MGLLALPNEILFLIAESLSYSWDVSVFSQLNRRLYVLLNAYVYQHNIRHCDGNVMCCPGQQSMDPKSLHGRCWMRFPSPDYLPMISAPVRCLFP